MNPEESDFRSHVLQQFCLEYERRRKKDSLGSPARLYTGTQKETGRGDNEKMAWHAFNL